MEFEIIQRKGASDVLKRFPAIWFHIKTIENNC